MPATPTDHSEAVSFPASAHPGEPCPDAGGEHPHHHDITLTFTQRTVLRRLLDRRPLAELDLDVVVGPLVGAGLVGHDGAYWCLTAEGRAYLAAHDEAKTRRTERPGPPTPPKGWSVVEDGPLPIRWWRFEGRLLSHVELCVDVDSTERALDEREEACTSVLALIRYLRALRSYRTREARDGAPVAPSAVRSGGTDGVGEGRPGEPPCASEVSP